RAPGDSVLLSCRASGFDIDFDFDFGDYAVLWYRHSPGGTLEWVSYINDWDTELYGTAVDGRATVTKDNSPPKSSLSLRALHPRDSARYFCAVRTG
ncbi:HV01 protein, partial [Balaeniceps rex]|nr:HV01 protein [Balaeniceps rex]